ncbi:hypothetical protein D3C86_1369300 [compost metagenome]
MSVKLLVVVSAASLAWLAVSGVPGIRPHEAQGALALPTGTPTQAQQGTPEQVDLSYYFRVWHTRVPGAVWQSPSDVPGYETLHIAPGVQAGDLTISPNGRYVWNSYGGKVGQWVRGDANYPIVLIDTVENKKWKVGYDPKHTGGRDIVIWDGYIWYDGKK